MGVEGRGSFQVRKQQVQSRGGTQEQGLLQQSGQSTGAMGYVSQMKCSVLSLKCHLSTRTLGLNSVGNRELSDVLRRDQIILFEKDDGSEGWGSVENELAGKSDRGVIVQ